MEEQLLSALIDLARKLEEAYVKILGSNDEDSIKMAVSLTVLSTLNDINKIIIKFK